VLQIYGLTDPEIISLLKQKKSAGVQVTIFYDSSASKTIPSFLEAHPVKSTGLMHRKILVIDDVLIFLGTANFTTQSLKMHDNLLFGAWNPDLAEFLQTSIAQNGSFWINDIEIQSFLLPDFEKKALSALKETIASAERTIHIALFTLTHPHLIESLIAAKNRGVEVQVAIDRYTALGASKQAVRLLKEAGITILLSQGDQLLHHKWALIDGETLIMGSANWTLAAFTKNQDCLLILKNLEKKEKKNLQCLWKRVAIASKKG